MNSKAKQVTIGIVAFNRLHYLQALLRSARESILHPNLQWILLDGGSTEEGTEDYLHSLQGFDQVISRECTHIEAMNQIVDLTESDYLLLLPDDFQFIRKGDWLQDLIELVDRYPRIGSVVFNAQRRLTINKFFGKRSFASCLGFPSYRTFKSTRGEELLSYGKNKLGINPAGICTFSRLQVWREMGPWLSPGTDDLRDSSGGGEDEMASRYLSGSFFYERVMMRIPVAASIHSGPANAQAFIRNGRRYDHYLPPKEQGLYYRVWQEDQLGPFQSIRPAPAIEDIVQPLGFDLEFDENGNFYKPEKQGDELFEDLPPKPL